MLVRRGMIDDLRAVLGEHIHQAAAVPHGTDQNLKMQIRVFFPQLKLDGICVVLIDVKDNETFGIMRRDLTAELGADTAASPP